MRTSLLPLMSATVLVASVGMAAAQSSTTTTTTWSNDDGAMIRQYSTTEHYAPVTDPSITPSVGVELPSTVTVYPLPQSVTVDNPDQYSYTIINNHPVVVERTTRRVIHEW
ncbi:MAG TPA: DUF1236 domain-containing protein [Stellaceae bacterium]|nr:DUF1236 domain-containing protein [Stellaceae bacterium]